MLHAWLVLGETVSYFIFLRLTYKPFSGCLKPLFQSEVKSEAIDIKILDF